MPFFAPKKRASTLFQPPSHAMVKSCGRTGKLKPLVALFTTGRKPFSANVR